MRGSRAKKLWKQHYGNASRKAHDYRRHDHTGQVVDLGPVGRFRRAKKDYLKQKGGDYAKDKEAGSRKAAPSVYR
jgi:hypothetical protein